MFGYPKTFCEFRNGRTWDLLCEPLVFRECQIHKISEASYRKAQIGFPITSYEQSGRIREMLDQVGFCRWINSHNPICIILRSRPDKDKQNIALLHNCMIHHIETEFYPADSNDISKLGSLFLSVVCMDCDFF